MTTDFTATPQPNQSNGAGRNTASPRSWPSRESGADAVESAHCPNVLARGTEFTGTIEVTDSIRLEGDFKGEVWTQGTLHVVPDANVEAEVQADFVVIGGNFKGTVVSQRRVDLRADCRAIGTLTTRALTVDEGALFDGDIVMTREPSGK